jgi:ferredoxin
MKLVVDHERCQGHGRCHAIAPELFDLDELGYSVLICEAEELPDAMAELASRAAAGCPERAIALDRTER